MTASIPEAPSPPLPAGAAPAVVETDDAPQDTGTPYRMAPGGSFHGTIDRAGDRDWVAVDLAPGLYRVSQTGIGLADPLLRVYDSVGSQVAYNDNDGARDASLLLAIRQAGTYYLAAGAHRDRGFGDYLVEIAPDPAATPLDAIRWGTRLDDRDPVTICFAKPGVTVTTASGTAVTSEGFAPGEIAAVMAVFRGVSGFADIAFARSRDPATADIVLALDLLPPGIEGFFDPPRQGAPQSVGVLSSRAPFWAPETLLPGGYMAQIVAHEIGHGLGLAHPFDDGGTSDVMAGVAGQGDRGWYGLNDSVFTVMSYAPGWSGGPLAPPDLTEGHMAGFGALDIAVLQQLYGINPTRAAGDNTYRLDAVAGFRCVWDTGGSDRISAAGLAGGAVIDLRAATLAYERGGGGFVSYRLDAPAGLTVAAGTLIEDATGSAGGDRVTGNAAGNMIALGAGDDVARGRAGRDRIGGGAGADILSGGDGRDRLTGGTEDDRLAGGPGGDDLLGGQGDDRLKGGAGDDIFRFRAIDGSDRILGFAEGDLVDLAPLGLAYGDLAFGLTAAGHVRVTAGALLLTFVGATADLDASDFLLA
jgi:serralysin